MPRAHRLVLAALLAIAGCGPVSTSRPPIPASAKPASVEGPPKRLWGIDPTPAKEFHEHCLVGDYNLPLPDSFSRAERSRVPGFLTVSIWSDFDDRDAIVFAGVFSGPDVLWASNDMPKMLDILTKATQPVTGYKLEKFDTPEANEMLGCKFTRVGWTGQSSDERPALGASYGAFDGENVVIICLMACGEEAQKRLTKLDAGVVSLKKR